MNKIKCLFVLLLVLYITGILFVLSYVGRHIDTQRDFQHIDTVTVVRVDTVTIIQPVISEEILLGHTNARLRRADVATKDSVISDTTNVRIDEAADSVDVSIPITQKHYADEMCDVWVSGYEPEVDSVKVYPKEVTTYIPMASEKKTQHKISVAVGPFVGVSPTGWTCGIGVTIGYNLWDL